MFFKSSARLVFARNVIVPAGAHAATIRNVSNEHRRPVDRSIFAHIASAVALCPRARMNRATTNAASLVARSVSNFFGSLCRSFAATASPVVARASSFVPDARALRSSSSLASRASPARLPASLRRRFVALEFEFNRPAPPSSRPAALFAARSPAPSPRARAHAFAFASTTPSAARAIAAPRDAMSRVAD